ncbi:hypothetical protein [Paenibacillus jiagnxiensis]|uniref:hypothetical protein n=1 Tax=Paenibacillus jiagnxiensis TaxID=3228926 RepID=UPI0033B151AB
MDNLDKKLISIFESDADAPLVRESLRDLIKLSGVLNELREYFEEPIKVLHILQLLNLIHEEALGLEQPLEDANALYYRYRNRYGTEPPLSVERLLYILEKYNWVIRTKRRILMMDVGKRLMDVLIRLANDSLAYYMRDEIARSLFQAARDADLSEAYDDKGISGGNRLASMVRNVEEAVEKLQERQLEFLADRHALPQVKIIVELMRQLDQRLNERMDKLKTFEEGMKWSSLFKKGTDIMLQGTQISLSTLQKILKFAHIQQTEIGVQIDPVSFKRYVMDSFYKKPDSTMPNGVEILSFMEQDRDEGERLDGLWVPVKFASPIPEAQLMSTIDYLEHYTPAVGPIESYPEEEFAAAAELTESELADQMEEAAWNITRTMIRTEDVERVLVEHKQIGIEPLVLEAGSEQWADAVNALLAVSAIVSNRQAEMTQETEKIGQEASSDQRKEWEWIDEADGRYIIRSNGDGNGKE